MIEDTQGVVVKTSLKSNHKNNHKKVVKKKKDIIIERQTAIRLEKLVKDDLSKIDYIMDNIDVNNPYKSFTLVKTEHGLHTLKFRMLFHYWKHKKEHLPHLMNLYTQLTDLGETVDQNELLSKIQKRLDDTEYKLYMMKHLSHLLPPLNIHEPRVKKLDDWQIEVLNYIKKGESIIVKAPTSSGKSFVGLSAGIIHKKILYVCPAKPIAYQVGAHFTMMGYKVHYLLDNLAHQDYDSKTNIFVGVPKDIEDNLYKIGTKFDYAVYDEIHNLNKEDDGNIYENIIKLVNCPFLALSATIGNIDYLMDIFTKINKTTKHIHYVEYTKRFINQQKMVYENGELLNLHPLACIKFEDLNSAFLEQNLQFTPYDSAVLWEALEEVFESVDKEEVIEDYSPDNYFEDDKRILTLDDTRDYEVFIKTKMIELTKDHRDEIKTVLSKFYKQPSIFHPTTLVKDIITMFTECKKKDCLPMLAFNTDTTKCNELFTNLYNVIDATELEYYPYHYDILDYKNDLYAKYRDKRQQFIESIKIGNTNDALSEKQEKVDRYDKDIERNYIQEVIKFYQSCIHNIKRHISTCDDDLKTIQLKNIHKELKNYQKYPTYGSIDVFQKHKDFCFSNSDPMTGDQIRSIKREIHKTLGIKIPYEHELFQMLKRGIGIYTENMPEEYKWILQKLMNDKKIGIVISDRTLCLGIDLPIRSSCLLGLPGNKDFTIDDYLQMSGRAGRRGKDDKGNTIFYNLDYHTLMKGELPTIVGSRKGIPGNYKALNVAIDNVYPVSINPNKVIDNVYEETTNPHMQWILRYESNVPDVINDIDTWNKAVYNSVSDMDKELCVLDKIIELNDNNYNPDIIECYKKNVIDGNYYQFKGMCGYLETIHNILRDKKYTHLKVIMTRVHRKIKDMVLRYHKLL
jgi:superfamily II RNA helicase